MNYYQIVLGIIAYIGVLGTIYSIAKTLTDQIHEEVFKKVVLSDIKLFYLFMLSFSPIICLFLINNKKNIINFFIDYKNIILPILFLYLVNNILIFLSWKKIKIFFNVNKIKFYFIGCILLFILLTRFLEYNFILILWVLLLIREFIFVIKLDKDYIYGDLFENYLKEVKSSHNNNNKDNFPEILKLFMLNLEYVSKENKVLEKELKWLKIFFSFDKLKDKYINIYDHLDRLVEKFKNNNSINCFYTILRFLKYQKTLLRKEDPKYQRQNLETLVKLLLFLKDFNNLNFYISDVYRLKIYLNEKIKEKDKEWIKNYGNLINFALNKQFEICSYILKSNIDNKEELFKNNWSYLISSLDFYSYKEFDFEEDEILKLKYEIIKNSFTVWRIKNVELIFLVMIEIDNNKVSSDFFQFCLKTYYKIQIDSNIVYEYEPDFYNIIFDNYDSFVGGGLKNIPVYNLRKYKMVFLFIEYIRFENLKFKRYLNEDFISENKFKEAIETFDKDFIEKYIKDFDENEIKKFIKKLKEEADVERKSIEEENKKKIIESNVDSEVEELKKRIIKYFNNNIKKDLKTLIESKNREFDKKNDEISFNVTINLLKEFFLKTDEEISENIFSDLQKQIYRVLCDNIKLRFIDEINKKDFKEYNIDDLYIDLKEIIKDENDYILFHNSDFHMDIIRLRVPNSSSKESDHYLDINECKVFTFFGNNYPNILISKDSFEINGLEIEDSNFKEEEDEENFQIKMEIKNSYKIEYNENFENGCRLIKRRDI